MIRGVICSACLIIAASSAAFSQASGPRVDLSLIVTDKANKSVNELRKEEVRVFENNVEQTILEIEADERPVDLGIAIDVSGSFRDLLPAAVEAVKMVINNRRPDDQIFIEKFVTSDTIQSLQDFTSDSNALLESLNGLHVQGGQSAVIDALYIAVKHVSEHNKDDLKRRKAVLIITDGEERNSFYNTEALIKLLHKEGVQVFALGIVVNLNDTTSILRASPRDRAEKFLKTATAETGGRVLFSRNGKELSEATLQIINHLRTQFRLTYQSTNNDPKKSFRKVEVKLMTTGGDERKIIAPAGYIVPSKAPAQSPDKTSP